MPGGRAFRMISRHIGGLRPPPFSSFAGFTDATSNWGLAGGVCARKFVQIKAIAAHRTYRIVNSLGRSAKQRHGHIVEIAGVFRYTL
jgi:hypothetical protein